MILHYLKIAWRNILKYKTQSIISVLGLAIGFTAFSFTLSWIRYEMGYDSHNPDADSIYRVAIVNEKEIGGFGKQVPDPLGNYLKSHFPEIEAATMVGTNEYFMRDSLVSSFSLQTDTSFFKVFYPEVKMQFPDPLPENGISLITSSFYDKLKDRGTPDSLLMDYKIIPEKNKHSNVAYEIINIRPYKMPSEKHSPWAFYSKSAYIRVYPQTDINLLQQKLDSIQVKGSMQDVMSYKLIPLRKVHYIMPNEKANIQFEHLRIFAAMSLLVILCSLFNYLMLFVNRIKIRSRELALRQVNGASHKQLILLLFCEFLFILLLSLFVGGILSELLSHSFIKLSQIEAFKTYFIREIFLYAGGLVLLSALVSLVPMIYFMKKGVHENIQPAPHDGIIKNGFTATTIGIQLIIGTLLIFATSIFLSQYLFLNQSDAGFDRHRVVHMDMRLLREPVSLSEVKSIAGVEDAIYFPVTFLPRTISSRMSFRLNKGTPDEREQEFEVFPVETPGFFDFFHIKVLEGRAIKEEEVNVCVMNQTARKLFGKESPIGKKLDEIRIIVGVIPDLYIDSPLVPVFPTLYYSTINNRYSYEDKNTIVYRYAEGSGARVQELLEELARGKDNFVYNKIGFYDMDEVYKEYTRSERYLLILLSIMTGVAILIAVFGIYSMITLSCNQRRKEIAIRKVNGARAKEILAMFFKQYAFITVLSCIIAFPVGALIMQRWLEQYTRRIVLDWWLFAGVFLLVALIVFGSILFRVLKAAGENPAEVVKSE
ncbi:MAG TPA: hypothetical protein DDZ96_00395 [Porphyromonadaceae bacterium]|nr:hypothetical protein [Porphyromonadaceae bacterium]HBX19692.1 hypothetical protein [Porphyromonadaceae bacterium]HCM20057.1 hypothetical protein [Porphyromonadaceae bacterium]